MSTRQPVYESIGRVALAVTYDASISSATSITLNASTKRIRVSAIDKGVFVRKQASVSSTLWDWFVPAGTSLNIDIDGLSVTIISVIEEAATAHVAVAEYDN